MTNEEMSGNTVRCGKCTWTGKGFQAPCLCPECGEITYLVERNDSNVTGDEQGYNGWPDRATWMIYTHLSNTEWVYRESQAVARRGAEDLYRWVTDEFLQEQTDPNRGGTALVGTSWLLASDLLTTALANVCWERVREALVGDAAEDA